MTVVSDIVSWMNAQAPLALSESWDNTGLLLGDLSAGVSKIQTCLTLTPASVDEAIRKQADLVIAHHPTPFKPLNRITTESYVGKLLWQLASHRIAVYSPHTAWDSAEIGINAMIATRLGLSRVQPLIPSSIEGLSHLGAGRTGQLDSKPSVEHFCKLVRQVIPNCRLRGVDCSNSISRIAIACGSGASLLGAAVKHGCDLFLTGEATFHQCLEAEGAGISMLLIGHFASEQFAMVELANRILLQFAEVDCWASQMEQDPVKDFHSY
ncbi:MAG: Nif3-like dinuclear metal center hexameric protein [Pirellulales bacterium]